MHSVTECKSIIFKCGLASGVSPKLISTRLLSDSDKTLMRKGLIEISLLKQFVEVWRDNGMPDQVSGRKELPILE